VDWDSVPPLFINPLQIPPEVQVKAMSLTNAGRRSLLGPGRLDEVTLKQARSHLRLQQVSFDVVAGLTKQYLSGGQCSVPAHRLFPQMAKIVARYIQEKVRPQLPGEKIDVYFSPYYGWLVERLAEAIRPDASQGETPEVPIYESSRGTGSTEDVDFWTKREPREVVHCHLNYVVPDTERWEQSAAYYIDTHPATAAFVKNAGLGFAIPYYDNGEMHEYVPDFVIRLNVPAGAEPRHVILETKGYDPLRDVKKAAADRWVAAVNADGRHGHWFYRLVNNPAETKKVLDSVACTPRYSPAQ
jgi:type III restriction enzyme